MPDPKSVTQWLDDLKQGDEEAARQLWQRYFQKMVEASRKKLGGTRRRAADEEDVAHIAKLLGISIHAVGRKLRMVRLTWSQELNV